MKACAAAAATADPPAGGVGVVPVGRYPCATATLSAELDLLVAKSSSVMSLSYAPTELTLGK